MTMSNDTRILRITTLLVYLIMGFIAFGGVVLALTSAALPIFWAQAAAEISKANPQANVSSLLPTILQVFALCLLVLGLVWTIMHKLLAIMSTVEEGDPFITANASRLRAIGWLMVGVQIIGLPLATIAGHVATVFGENNVDYDFSLNGILAILLIFVLAGIFERGAAMRQELEGTV